MREGREEIIEAEIVCPGFVDIHTHGIGGSDQVLIIIIIIYLFLILIFKFILFLLSFFVL